MVRVFLVFIKKCVSYLYLKIHGVETRFGYCNLVGFPYINRHKNSKIKIGENVTIISKKKANLAGINNRSHLVTLCEGAQIVLNNNSGISGAKIVSACNIELGKWSGLGVNCTIYDTDFHPLNFLERRNQRNIKDSSCSPVYIGNDVLIGANSIILKGTTIGDKTIVGAGSVVAGKRLVKNSVYGGNPVKKIKDL